MIGKLSTRNWVWAFALIFASNIIASSERQRIYLGNLINKTAESDSQSNNIAKFVENRTAKALRSQLSRYFTLVDNLPNSVQLAAELNPKIMGQLGGTTDLVITGEYTLKGFSLKLKIRIYDVESSKLAQELDYEGEADSTLDSFIDNVTQDIRGKISELDAVVIAQHRKLNNQIGILAGAGFRAVPEAFAGRLEPGVTLYPADFEETFHLAIEYQLRHIGLQNLLFFIQPRVEAGKRPIPVQNNDKQVDGQITGYSGLLGAGYIWHFGKSFYATPLLGMGYYRGLIQLDYKNLDATPFEVTSGLDQQGLKINTAAWIGRTELRFGYRLGQNIALEVGAGITGFFFNQRTSGVVFANAGIGYAF